MKKLEHNYDNLIDGHDKECVTIWKKKTFIEDHVIIEI